jgi:class 3 adenylate cyclase
MSRLLPHGVVSFFMSDVEDSSAWWRSDATAMRDAVAALDLAVEEYVDAPGGHLLKARGEGDSHFAVFDRPSDAVVAALALHRRLGENDSLRRGVELRVRVAVHVGEAEPTDSDYYGMVVNQTARLRTAAHGGQTWLSRTAAALAQPALGDKVRLTSLGYHRLRDFARLEEVFEAGAQDAEQNFPPLRTGESHGPAVLSIVLIDVCGASARLRNHEDMAREQRIWAAMLQTAAHDHGAVALKLLGDGCLCAFEDPLEALAFVTSIEELFTASELRIRAGLEAGRVEIADGEIIGEAVLTSADLCRRATPGQTLITRSLQQLAGTRAARGALVVEA